MLSVFDLDHTLIKKNSSLQFGFFLFREGVFTWKDLCYLLYLYIRHLTFQMPSSLLHQKALTLVKGKSLALLQQKAEEFVSANLKEMINHRVWCRMQEAKEKGHKVMLLSNSPDFLVKTIGTELGISYSKGVDFDLDENCCLRSQFFTMEGEKKRELVYIEAKKWGIGKSEITAYSDSYLDLALLEGAGCAVAVNPDSQLRSKCLENGWEIMS